MQRQQITTTPTSALALYGLLHPAGSISRCEPETFPEALGLPMLIHFVFLALSFSFAPDAAPLHEPLPPTPDLRQLDCQQLNRLVVSFIKGLL